MAAPMAFHIVHDRPWLEARLEESGGGDDADLDRTLSYLAGGSSSPRHADFYITKRELLSRRRDAVANWRVARLLGDFFNLGVRGDTVPLKSPEGGTFEEMRVFDDGDGVFETFPQHASASSRPVTDGFFGRAPGGPWRNLASEALAAAERILFEFYSYDHENSTFLPRTEPVDFSALLERLADPSRPFPPRLELDPAMRRAWTGLRVTDGISTAMLMALYRMARTARQRAASGIFLSDAVNFGELRAITDTASPGDAPGDELQNRVTANLLSSLLLELKIHKPSDKIFDDQLSLIVTHSCHVINATGGAYGIGVLKHLSAAEWEIALDDADTAHAVASSLARALKSEAGAFSRDLARLDGDSLKEQFLRLLVSRDPGYGETFKAVIAVALLKAFSESPDFFSVPLGRALSESDFGDVAAFCRQDCLDAESATTGDAVFSKLDGLNKTPPGQLPRYHDALVRLVLDSFGALANSGAATEVKTRAFAWCETFHDDFTTFLDANASEETRERQKRDDRLALLKTQRVLAALDAPSAREYFFNLLLEPLNASFDPRAEKWAAHNDYYRRIGAAQQLAAISGKRKLAFLRRLDEENNEWGRITEKAIRDNDLFRLEFLKEAYVGDPAARAGLEKMQTSFDPTGVLQDNLCYLHALRYVYLNRAAYDPAADTDTARAFAYAAALDLRHVLDFDVPAPVYRGEAREFDDWLLSLKRRNPDFRRILKDRLMLLSAENRRLPLKILFLEINEAEYYQYEITPDKAPAAMLGFVGTIRSWTSGYHGRVLTRMRMFFDQRAIERDKAKNPRTYRRPEEYFPDYASVMSPSRFETTVLPILKEGESPANGPRTRLPAEEALLLIKHFEGTGFTAYLPQWALFLAEYRFLNADGSENFAPMAGAFAALGKSRFPRPLLEAEFSGRGYLDTPEKTAAPASRSRQARRKAMALACLKRLPDARSREIPYDAASPLDIRKRIRRAGEFSADFVPTSYEKLVRDFTAPEIGPGAYFEYRAQARKLLKTRNPDAIFLLIEEALETKRLDFPKNAPLSPLLGGLVGGLIPEKKFEEALYGIASAGPAQKKGLASVIDFSAVMIRWAERNRVDFTQIFSEAFGDYEIPPRIRSLHENVLGKERELAGIEARLLSLRLGGRPEDDAELLDAAKRKREVAAEAQAAADERNRAIITLARDPAQKSDQILFQIIASIYNAIRRQYLKEVLITGGATAGRLIESHLEDVLIPRKRELTLELDRSDADLAAWRSEWGDVQRRIEFLTDILAQIETSE